MHAQVAFQTPQTMRMNIFLPTNPQTRCISNQFFCHGRKILSPTPNAAGGDGLPTPAEAVPSSRFSPPAAQGMVPTSPYTHTAWGERDTPAGQAGQASPAHIPNIFRQQETRLHCLQPLAQGWEETWRNGVSPARLPLPCEPAAKGIKPPSSSSSSSWPCQPPSDGCCLWMGPLLQPSCRKNTAARPVHPRAIWNPSPAAHRDASQTPALPPPAVLCFSGEHLHVQNGLPLLPSTRVQLEPPAAPRCPTTATVRVG